MGIIVFCIKRWPSLALWLIIMLLITVPLVGITISHPYSIRHLQGIVSHCHTVCTIFRWFFLLILFLIWPKIVRFYARKRYWPIEKTAEWIARRFQLLLWLTLFELMVNEQLLLALWNLWESH